MNEFIQSLLISLIIAILAYIARKLRKWFNKINKLPRNTKLCDNPKQVKNQFFISLLVFTVSLIALCTSKNIYIISFSILPIFFSFILLWGALKFFLIISKSLIKPTPKNKPVMLPKIRKIVIQTRPFTLPIGVGE